MVRVVDNATDLEGRVQGVAPDPARAGWVVWTLRVVGSRAVAGLPDLLRPEPGARLQVALPEAAVRGVDPAGGILCCRACLEGPGRVCVRDPDGPVDFTPGASSPGDDRPPGPRPA